MPEFVRAYEPDGMTADEFIGFGATQRTLGQFAETAGNRWKSFAIMATPVEMPKLGNSVEECLLSAVGQARRATSIAAGDLVAEIETDKTTFEVSAPVAGTLLARFFDEGALVPVFTNLFVIGAPGESARPSGRLPRE